MPGNEEQQLVYDIRRTIILGGYMRHWGMPDTRTISRRGDESVEIYSFPPKFGGKVHRIATVGLSSQVRESGEVASYELCMVLPEGLGGATKDQVTSFIMDVAAYSLRRDVRFEIGRMIPETPLMPTSWLPRALLLDEPRGEPEEIASFQVGSQRVALIWLVPIHTDEYELIARAGLEAFDELDGRSEWSLTDPKRPSFVQ